MKLIVCLDDNNGMLFNKRRQSSDAELCKHIYRMTAGRKLWMNEYSAKLFAEYSDVISVDECFLELADEDDYCFLEKLNVTPILSGVREIIIFKWNRVYPADTWFPAEIMKNFKLIAQEEFPGKSHKTITKEVYTL